MEVAKFVVLLLFLRFSLIITLNPSRHDIMLIVFIVLNYQLSLTSRMQFSDPTFADLGKEG